MQPEEMVERAHFGERAYFVAIAPEIAVLRVLEHVVREPIRLIELSPVDLREQGEVELDVGAAREEA